MAQCGAVPPHLAAAAPLLPPPLRGLPGHLLAPPSEGRGLRLLPLPLQPAPHQVPALEGPAGPGHVCR